MPQPAEVACLTQGCITTGDTHTQLRSDVLEYVQRFLACILRGTILVRYVKRAADGPSGTPLRVHSGLSCDRSRCQDNKRERNEQTSFHWFYSSRKFDCSPAGLQRADLPACQPRRGCRRHHRFFVGRRADNHHSYTHIERPVHLGGLDLPRFPKDPENVLNPPTRGVDHCIQRRWQRPVEILDQSTTGDVRHRVQTVQHRPHGREIRFVLGEEHIGNCPATTRKCVCQSEPEPVRDDLSRQRITVGVQTRAWKSDQHVIRPYPIRAKYPVFFHISDDETRQVVIGRCIQPRHFSRFAAYERAAVFPAARGNTRHDRFDDVGVELSERHVVKEKERQGPLHQDVVHAMVYEIPADGVVTTGIDGHFDFGADTVSARYEHGLSETGRHPEHSAETTERADDASREGGLYELLYSLLCRVGRIDIHTGASVAKRFVAHAGSASSNATSRRMSRIRWSISARVTVIRRSIENFSTAKDPITEP